MVGGMSEGHIELTRAVASIHVGYRLRTDLGDLTELAASIRELGLLQPITISPDGTLICGVRRYAAVLELGWKTVNVWVRSGISTDLDRVLAQQHENTLRKSFSPTEAARLYAELKTLYQEDAARRKQVTQFGSPKGGELCGPADSAGPHGDARVQAAKAITGKRSDFTLEHVLQVHHLATDPETPEPVQNVAIRELAAMDIDGKVHGHFLTVQSALADSKPSPKDPAMESGNPVATMPAVHLGRVLEEGPDLADAAKAALARARAARSAGRAGTVAVRNPPTEVAPFSLRAFVMTINETDYWWLHYDPDQIGPVLTAAQWEQFDDWAAHTATFHQAARTAAGRGRPTPVHADGDA
jgi:ParB family chromosome partitioning protein